MIREFIIDAFKKSGLTQKELSEKTGIDRSSLSLYLSGKRDFLDENKEKLMDALNIRLIIVEPGETVFSQKIKE